MNAQQHMDDILNECLDRLARGETMEACLARYPEHAPELRPLLIVARATLAATVQITPRAEFRIAARHRFLDALAARHARERESFFTWSWTRRWGAVAAGVALLVVIGRGTVAAAESSLPTQPLYTIKQATEAFQIALAPEGSAKAKVYTELAARRLVEMTVLARQGDVQNVDRLTAQLEAHLDNATLAASRASPEPAPSSESVPSPTATSTPSAAAAQAAQPAATATPSPTATPTAAASVAPAATPTAVPSAAAAQAAQPAASPTPPAAPAAAPAPAATLTPVARPAPTTSPAIRQPAVTPSVPARATGKTPDKPVKPGARPAAQNLQDMQATLRRNVEQHKAALEKALQEAPPSARPALEKALEKANRKYAQAIKALERMEQLERERERQQENGR
ncbi:MAG: DUF5667 domain-containing protein [Chloroflexota bacterium]